MKTQITTTIKEQPLTIDNMLEQMALMVKNILIDKGVPPTDANKMAIEFIKERGEKIALKIAKGK